MKNFRLACLIVLANPIASRHHGFGTPLFGVGKSSVPSTLRGGSYDAAEESTGDFLPPRISAEDMSLALRWTGEINRRLEVGTRPRDHEGASVALVHPRDELGTVTDASLIRGGAGDDSMDHHHHVAAASPETIADSTMQTSSLPPQLTLFHAQSPRPTGNGANRWGPHLESYIRHICRQLDLSEESSVELVLALMYLDRATSAETPRSNGVPACPYLQPRTAHRLVLAALLLATQSTHGWPLPVLMERVENLGIPPERLAYMLEWMQGALGDPGYFVTQHQISTWRHVLQQTARLRPTKPEPEGMTTKPQPPPVQSLSDKDSVPVTDVESPAELCDYDTPLVEVAN